MILGINASRARSGGARAHLIGILTEGNPTEHGIKQVHVWSYRELLDALPSPAWLIKHCPAETEASMIRQIWWEKFSLPTLLKASKCDILLNVGAGTLCHFKPAVTMSRDMLSYEPGEMERFGFSMSRLRLIVLRYVQNSSLRNANVAVFLTRYAADMIQRSAGQIRNIAYIPHGVSDAFRKQPRKHLDYDDNKPLQCLYISNALPYKHQWHVVDAIGQLRKQGFDIELTLVGGGIGSAQQRLQTQITKTDPVGTFVHQHEFVPQATLPDFLAAADLFVFASSCENMPNTLIEAMAMGLPIACSNRGPMPEVLEDGGIYFDPEDPKDIADAVRALILDSNKAGQLAQRAQQLSLQYSWSRCADDTFKLIAKTVEQAEPVQRNK